MSLQGWLTLSNSLAACGAILVALGGFGHYWFSYRMSSIPPDVTVEKVIPVVIYERKQHAFGPDKKVEFMDKGISLVLQLETDSRPVTVNRLMLRGKLHVSASRYLQADGTLGRTLGDIQKEWEQRKPYMLLELTAFVDETKCSNSLDAFESKLVCFTLTDPIVSGQSEGGWEIPFSDYLGYSDGTKSPLKTRTYPEFDFFFKTHVGQDFPYDVRDEIKSGEMELILVAGSREIAVPYSCFESPKLANKRHWDSSPIEKIISRKE